MDNLMEMFNNPEMMDSMKNLMSNPDMQKMMNDPNIMESLKNPDLLNNLGNMPGISPDINKDHLAKSDVSDSDESESNESYESKFSKDDVIKTKGLRNDLYNERVGMIMNYNKTTNRYTICFSDDNKVVAIKEENIEEYKIEIID